MLCITCQSCLACVKVPVYCVVPVWFIYWVLLVLAFAWYKLCACHLLASSVAMAFDDMSAPSLSISPCFFAFCIAVIFTCHHSVSCAAVLCGLCCCMQGCDRERSHKTHTALLPILIFLCCSVSSEAMLGGQKAPYKLLVRAVNQYTGLEVPYITFVASDDFVVCSCLLPPCQPSEVVKDLTGVACMLL